MYLSRYSSRIVIMLLVYVSFTVFADGHDKKLDLEFVEEIEINEQFSGTKVIAKDLRISETEILDFNKDGAVVSSIRDKEREGIWYTDSRGKHCIKWNNKDKSICADIMRDDEGNWVKVKDDVIIKKYESFDRLNKNNQSKDMKKVNIEKEIIKF